jgi:hypothetical protein
LSSLPKGQLYNYFLCNFTCQATISGNLFCDNLVQNCRRWKGKHRAILFMSTLGFRFFFVLLPTTPFNRHIFHIFSFCNHNFASSIYCMDETVILLQKVPCHKIKLPQVIIIVQLPLYATPYMYMVWI